MTVLALVAVLVAGTLGTPAAALAQAAKPLPRIGYLAAAGGGTEKLYENAFLAGLRELGYVDGQNVVIEYRFAEGRSDRLPQLGRDLVRGSPDVIVTAGQNAARAVQEVTTSIPVVVAAMPDPVAAGLVASLGRPGGNVTGLSFMSTELDGKRLGLLKEAIPTARRVAVMINPDSLTGPLRRRETEAAARTLGITVQPLEVRRPEDVEAAFRAAVRDRADALLVFREFVVESQRSRVVDLAARSKLPAMYEQLDFVEDGGLMAYGPSLADLYRRAATYVDRIPKRAKPGDLPIEQPTQFELIINLKTSKALGIKSFKPFMDRADRFIQ